MKTLSVSSLVLAPILLSGCVMVCVGPRDNACPCCKPESTSAQKSAASQAKPGAFNVDFGPWKTAESKQTGPAAVGKDGDFWNTVAQPFNDSHTEVNLKWADGKPSPVEVEMRNLGGGWGFSGKLGIPSSMLDDFNYPANNKGGNSQVLLHKVPKGKYDVFIYGHGTQPDYFGDYALKCGDVSYGRKTTYAEDNDGTETKWKENRQYVKFSNVKADGTSALEILIRPGNPVDSGHGTQISDAIIAGLQLVPK